MAQYGVGHLDRVERIERLCQKLPGLALAGNAYRGIGVPDCVRSGREAAMKLAPVESHAHEQ
jgi:oxygen-dependent protoporphyrinogen oxidase